MRTLTQIIKPVGIVSIAALVAISPLFSTASASAAPVNLPTYSAPEVITGSGNGFETEYFQTQYTAPFESGVILGGSISSVNQDFHLSFDSGETWINHPTFRGEPEIFTSSGSGATLVLGTRSYNENTGNEEWTLVITQDHGASWQTQTLSFANNSPSLNIGVDYHGQAITAVPEMAYDAQTTSIYLSNDGGLTWERQYVTDETTDELSRATHDVTMSVNGSVLTAVSFDETQAAISVDRGETWRIIGEFTQISHLEVTQDGQFVFLRDQTAEGFTWHVGQLFSNGIDYWQHITEDFASNYSFDAVLGSGSASVIVDGKHYRLILYSHEWEELSSLPVPLNAEYLSFHENAAVGVYTEPGLNPTIYITYDGGVSWDTQSLGESQGFSSMPVVSRDSFVIAGYGYIGTSNIRAFFVSRDQGVTWQNPVNQGLANWEFVKQSADGSVILALSNTDQQLYTSQSGGTTWTRVPNPPGAGDWNSEHHIVSPNGQVLLATRESGENGSNVAISRDRGATWQMQTIPGFMSPRSLATSNTGSTLYLGAIGTDWQNQRLVSYDAGENWTDITIAGFGDITGITVSGSGTLYAFGMNEADTNSVLAKSTNSGQSWALLPVPDEFIFEELVVSGDGQTILASGLDAEWQSQAYVSTTDGQSWSEIPTPEYLSPTLSLPTSFAASYDGQTLASIGLDENFERIFSLSADGGATWQTFTASDFGLSTEIEDLSVSQYGRVFVKIRVSGQSMRQYSYTDTAGSSWQVLSTGDANARNYHMNVSRTGESIILFSSSPSLMYKSTLNSPVTEPLQFTPTSTPTPEVPQSTNPASPQKISNPRPTFSGTALPFSVITVTVNSDPIVCTTTADATGNWSCTLPSDIPSGLHTITTVVEDPVTGVVTTYGPYYIQVDPDSVLEGDEDGLTTPVDSVPGVPATGFGAQHTSLTALIGGILLAITALAVLRIRRIHQTLS